ncbi:barstar family protein [Janthinobacterium sp. 1_2014MBL_MicDiv]|uniref:barstar family protein n=1 Tax=Janthinobacterium sp. 1_2014MBL_MicDiv TaxID=1644131 RepID=UPI0009F66549|nr:barstar family protein [Janthinobacterium sp. 1_2014MBL_MicDiv]
MLNNIGFFAVDEAAADKIILDSQREGMRVFCLPEKISSKDEFFDGVRNTLPLDPPLHSNRSWEALADSLWSGLDGLEDENIVIVWRDTKCMETHASEDFSIAIDILNDLPGTLADPKLTVGMPKKLLVLHVV